MSSLRRHKKHIRHLTVTDNAVLLAALDSNLTDLLALTMQTFPNTSGTFSAEFSMNLVGDSPSVSESGASRWKTVVLRDMFASYYRRGEAACIRASWLLVLENPGLQHLVFMWNWNILFSEVKWGANKYRTPVPLPGLMVKGFLDRVFRWLTSIRHVNIGLYTDNYLLSNLPTLLPNITTFVHSGVVFFDAIAIQLAPYPKLKCLTFSQDSGGYIDDDDDTENSGVNMETPMNILEYLSLESFVFTNYRGHIKLLNPRVRFPRIKKMRSYSKIVGPSIVRQAL
ncbi:hypothetical protein BG015_006860 [Linnemannia schmuckeri]|uniref:Uncharacterized protein n=1 Tax=Linnemannia schmuckeri TaxID=64567 RepID=A0A9P5RZ96_9FUNG|nr:hypothetical protein BG015_006860 [Linnemannia schmuckeri]